MKSLISQSEKPIKGFSAAPKQEFIYDWEGNAVHFPFLTVPDHEGTPTGVLDHNGEEIVRQPRKIGFL